MATHSSVLAWRIPWTEKQQRSHCSLDEGYLLTTTPSDLECGIAPLGPPAPTQLPLNFLDALHPLEALVETTTNDPVPCRWQGEIPQASPCSPRDSQKPSPTPQFNSINSSALSLLHSPTLCDPMVCSLPEERGCGPVTGKDRASCQSGGAPALRPGALSDSMDCSPPSSSVHGTFQARVPEWGAIAFSVCESTSSLLWGFSPEARRGSQGASRAVPGKSGLHARGEGERVMALESWDGGPSGGRRVEKAMAPHSSTLAWKIPWTEELGGLQSMGSLRVGHN